MIYGSVCSGIEAASCAWHPLGWQPAFFAEIEKFCCELLKNRWPEIPNLGSILNFKHWPDYAIRLLVGGTPCQSFSVAGLRAGLADPRGNLMLTYLAIAARYRPEWLVWENVPGVLSSNGGRDFGTLLGGLAKLGYGFAYRVLDAQYVRVESHARAVPQRRRRVFVVGCFGGWRRAAAVLFERESLCGHTPPRRGATQDVAGTLEASFNERSGSGQSPGGLVARCVTARQGRDDYDTQDFVAALTSRPYADNDGRESLLVSHSLTGEGCEDGSGRGCPLVATTLTRGTDSAGIGGYAGRRQEDDSNLVALPLGTRVDRGGSNREAEGNNLVAATLTKEYASHNGRTAGNNCGIAQGHLQSSRYGVRRLTPLECERLQGFSDGYTDILYWKKPAKDGPRYRAIGNSMAVNVMRWIGERIQAVEAISEPFPSARVRRQFRLG